MTVNTEVARKIVEAIDNHRKAFDMYHWHRASGARGREFLETVDGHEFVVTPENIEEGSTQCGTTLCIAGFAVLQAGFKVKYYTASDSYGKWLEQMWIDPRGRELSDEPGWIEEGAAALGLDEQTASRLFHYTNSNDVALSALRELADGVDPESIEILQDDSRHCECLICNFPERYEDSYRCTCDECLEARGDD